MGVDNLELPGSFSMRLKGLKPYRILLLIFCIFKLIRKWCLEEEEWILMMKRKASLNVSLEYSEKSREVMETRKQEYIQPWVKQKNGTAKKTNKIRSKRKIGARKKNFGNLAEWDPDPKMKKVSSFFYKLSVKDVQSCSIHIYR